MFFVSDTHGLVMFLSNDIHLGKSARKVFEDAERGLNTILVSSIVLAELVHMAIRKRVEMDVLNILDEIGVSKNYRCVELGIPALKKCLEIPRVGEIHDKIIVATAMLAKAKVVTRDKEISDSGYVETVW